MDDRPPDRGRRRRSRRRIASSTSPCGPARSTEFVGQERVKEQLAAPDRRRAQPRRAGGPPAVQRAAGARQDDARPDRRARDGGRVPAHVGARAGPSRATSRRSSRTSRTATCCSWTRSTACRVRSRRCCIRRSRTSTSTSSWARAPTARSIRLELPRFTLVGATTRPGRITLPLRERFGFSPRLDYYSVDELTQIVGRSAGILGRADRRATARRRDRAGARAARRGSRTGCCAGCATSPRSATRARSRARSRARASSVFEVDEEGLDRLDHAILRAIVEKFGGGPVGLSTLAAAVGEETGHDRGRGGALPAPAGVPAADARGAGLPRSAPIATSASTAPGRSLCSAPRARARAVVDSSGRIDPTGRT